MRIRTFLFITALMLCHPQLWPQALTRQFPSAANESAASGGAEPSLANDSVAQAQSPQVPAGSLPDAPGYPIAEVVEKFVELVAEIVRSGLASIAL